MASNLQACPSADSLAGWLDDNDHTIHEHVAHCGTCRALAELSRPNQSQQAAGIDQIPTPPAHKYTPRTVLGRGGQGVVWESFDTYLDRSVALKELHAKADAHAHARFVREARVAGRLAHPNILTVYELGRREPDGLFYTMPKVDGHTLAHAIADAGTLSNRLELLVHFVDACQAVAYAHEHGVIHRDLTSANILIGQFGETRVFDWGLAALRNTIEPKEPTADSTNPQERPGVTRIGMTLGTPAFMSPEQARGETADTRTDIWGLGAILFEIACGRAPYAHLDAAEQIDHAARGAYPSVKHIVPTLPKELAGIIEKALAFAPDDRYQRAQDLLDDIQAYLASDYVSCVTYSPTERFRRFLGRHASIAIAALVVTTVLAISLVVILFSYRAEEAARSRAEKNAAAARAAKASAESLAAQSQRQLAHGYIEKASTLVLENRLIEAGIYATAATDALPDHAPTSPNAIATEEQIRAVRLGVVQQAGRSTLQKLAWQAPTSTVYPYASLAWSPDGALIVYTSPSGVDLRTADGQLVKTITTSPARYTVDQAPMGVTFAQNHDRFAVIDSQAIYEFDSHGNAVATYPQPPGRGWRTLSYAQGDSVLLSSMVTGSLVVTERETKTYQSYRLGIRQPVRLITNATGTKVAVSGYLGGIETWDTMARRSIKTFSTKAPEVPAMLRDGRLIYFDSQPKLFDFSSQTSYPLLPHLEHIPIDVDWVPATNSYATYLYSGHLRLQRRLPNSTTMHKLEEIAIPATSTPLRAVRASDDKLALITSGRLLVFQLAQPGNWRPDKDRTIPLRTPGPTPRLILLDKDVDLHTGIDTLFIKKTAQAMIEVAIPAPVTASSQITQTNEVAIGAGQDLLVVSLNGDSTPIKRFEAPVTRVAASPDGTEIAATHGNHCDIMTRSGQVLQRWRIETPAHRLVMSKDWETSLIVGTDGKVRAFIRGHKDPTFVSKDDAWTMALRAGNNLFVANGLRIAKYGSNPKRLVPFPIRLDGTIRWVTSGGTGAYLLVKTDRSISLYHSRDGSLRWRMPSHDASSWAMLSSDGKTVVLIEPATRAVYSLPVATLLTEVPDIRPDRFGLRLEGFQLHTSQPKGAAQ